MGAATGTKAIDGGFSERLSALDQMFLLSEQHNTHMHVAVTAILDAGPLRNPAGGIDIDRIRAHIGARLRWIPRYRQKLSRSPLGSPIWVDDDRFNLAYHVRHTSLPRPGDERALQALAGRIKSQQLDREKPLWEMWLVEGMADGRVALVTKAHHCMIDGISGADLLAVLLSPESSVAAEAQSPFTPRPHPGAVALIAQELGHRIAGTFEAGRWAISEPRAAARALGERASALANMLPAAFWRAADTPFNRPIGPHRRFDWLPMDLAEVKAVKHALGGTVNDVVLAVVSGALRRFLVRRRVNVDGLELRAMVPVSVRAEHERGGLGNRVAGWLTPLPVGEGDARRRLACVREQTKHLKDSKQAMATETLTGVTDWTSSTVLSVAIQLALRVRPFNLVVTNVPGPQVPLYLLGARMQEVYPQVPLFTNQGLGIALFSYDGTLFWGFNADWDLVPDLADLVDDVRASFAELHRASRLPRPRRRPIARPSSGEHMSNRASVRK